MRPTVLLQHTDPGRGVVGRNGACPWSSCARDLQAGRNGQTRTDKPNEEASAAHREELAQFQSNLLKKNTDLTEQIHTLTQKMNTRTEEVHQATCKARSLSN
jgi:hypothetical protein